MRRPVRITRDLKPSDQRTQILRATEDRHSMQEILRTLGNRIRSLREQKGISQEAFADICGLHRTAVGLIERGRSIPRLDTLLVISEHLGVALSELVEGLKH